MKRAILLTTILAIFTLVVCDDAFAQRARSGTNPIKKDYEGDVTIKDTDKPSSTAVVVYFTDPKNTFLLVTTGSDAEAKAVVDIIKKFKRDRAEKKPPEKPTLPLKMLKTLI